MPREINYFKLSGTILEIGEPQQYVRKSPMPSIYKVILVIETVDGQRLFPEIRNIRIKQLENKNIAVGDLVQIEYSFEGSEKGGKRYNNIFINKIDKI
jgi:DNA helicase TIP49 (TBP-interacting protein)